MMLYLTFLLCCCSPVQSEKAVDSIPLDSVDTATETGTHTDDSTPDSSDSGESPLLAPELILTAAGAVVVGEDRMIGGYDDGYGGWVALLYADEPCPLDGHESRTGVIRSYTTSSLLQLGTACGVQDGDMIEYDGLICAAASDGSLSCFPPDIEGYVPDEAYRRVAGMSGSFGHPILLSDNAVVVVSVEDRYGVAMDEISGGTAGEYMFSDYADDLCEDGVLCGVSGASAGDVLLLAAPGGNFYAHTMAGAPGDGWPARWSWSWGSTGSERTRAWITESGTFLLTADGVRSTELNPETGFEVSLGGDPIGGMAIIEVDGEDFRAIASGTQVCVSDSCVELSVEVTDLAPCGDGCVAGVTQAGALMVMSLARPETP